MVGSPSLDISLRKGDDERDDERDDAREVVREGIGDCSGEETKAEKVIRLAILAIVPRIEVSRLLNLTGGCRGREVDEADGVSFTLLPFSPPFPSSRLLGPVSPSATCSLCPVLCFSRAISVLLC